MIEDRLLDDRLRSRAGDPSPDQRRCLVLRFAAGLSVARRGALAPPSAVSSTAGAQARRPAGGGLLGRVPA
ncbi:hypothetical protein ACL03H_02880 [Saccharopolyspora sp. MS10]|uniref:hypothetical protein n=1 Tax=Saccharopolyspora sp. MS10 TaxID=3385973 RepID=UPI0039A138B0